MRYVGNAVPYKNYSFYYHFHILVSHAHVQLNTTPWPLIIIYNNLSQKVEVKQSRNRPGVAQRVPGGLGSQISRHSACVGGEVVSLTHQPPLPPGMFLVLIFTRGWVDPRAMVRSEGNMSPLGINPRTIWVIAQHLNHYTTPGPHLSQNNFLNTEMISLYMKETPTIWYYHSFPLTWKTTTCMPTLSHLTSCATTLNYSSLPIFQLFSKIQPYTYLTHMP